MADYNYSDTTKLFNSYYAKPDAKEMPFTDTLHECRR